jgi:hypothetical protein
MNPACVTHSRKLRCWKRLLFVEKDRLVFIEFGGSQWTPAELIIKDGLDKCRKWVRRFATLLLDEQTERTHILLEGNGTLATKSGGS